MGTQPSKRGQKNWSGTGLALADGMENFDSGKPSQREEWRYIDPREMLCRLIREYRPKPFYKSLMAQSSALSKEQIRCIHIDFEKYIIQRKKRSGKRTTGRKRAVREKRHR